MNDDVRDASSQPSGKSGLKIACLIVAIVGFVGVVVIGALVALLVPALSAAREKARRSACMSNLNYLAMAMESYVGDYKGYLPESPEVLVEHGYLPDPILLCCPSRMEDSVVTSSYIYVPYETVKDMLSAPVVYDKAENHGDGRNVLFGDWHIEWVPKQNLPDRFDREAQSAPAFKEYLDEHGVGGSSTD